MKKSVGVNLVDGANFVNSLDSFLSQFSCQVLIFINLSIFSSAFSSSWVTKYSRICMKSSTNSNSNPIPRHAMIAKIAEIMWTV